MWEIRGSSTRPLRRYPHLLLIATGFGASPGAWGMARARLPGFSSGPTAVFWGELSPPPSRTLESPQVFTWEGRLGSGQGAATPPRSLLTEIGPGFKPVQLWEDKRGVGERDGTAQTPGLGPTPTASGFLV